MDDEIRKLEREAAAGDLVALAKLERMRQRGGGETHWSAPFFEKMSRRNTRRGEAEKYIADVMGKEYNIAARKWSPDDTGDAVVEGVKFHLYPGAFVCPDPNGPDCHDDRCSRHYGAPNRGHRLAFTCPVCAKLVSFSRRLQHMATHGIRANPQDEDLRRARRELDKNDPRAVLNFFYKALRSGDVELARLARVHAYNYSMRFAEDGIRPDDNWMLVYNKMCDELTRTQPSEDNILDMLRGAHYWSQRLNPGDEDLRALERLAASGDEMAKQRLALERSRRGDGQRCTACGKAPVVGHVARVSQGVQEDLDYCDIHMALYERERLQSKNKSDPVCHGYLDLTVREQHVPAGTVGDRGLVTTWHGFPLVAVVQVGLSHTGWHNSGITSWRGIDFLGRPWHGKGAGDGMSTVMRFSKTLPRRGDRQAIVRRLNRLQNEWMDKHGGPQIKMPGVP